MIDERLDSLVTDRLAAIQRAKSEGVKVVGYLPGPYVPEELIYASGALPVCLAYGGDAQVSDYALSLLPPIICPFSRAQAGEMLLKTNPVYDAIDMVVVPSTCQHYRMVGDVWEHQEWTDIFKLGVPYDPREEVSLVYFRDRMADLRERLESLTGKEITVASIKGAIAVYDRLREALRNISLLRRNLPPGVSGLEFMKLNHASLIGDPVATAEVLEAFYSERLAAEPGEGDGPARLLLVGPNVGIGDYGILEMVESAGATVVMEDVFEGVRDYWCTVGQEGDPLDALTRAHLTDRVPAAFMRSSTGPRFDLMSKTIPLFQVEGVIWYELLCCEFYDQEAYFYENKLRELNIPMLMIESNYDDLRSGSIRTRLEAFLEVVQGGPADA
ncbi:MAG: 2-hydroxyacyl-CoA dehydratase [Thermoleophilia bacterium]|nr:2-hydroxyacyl-CoA dehydratase [Thermoleophilia bacterium]